MSDYTKFVDLAQRLIAKRGRLVSLLELGGSATTDKPWKGQELASVVTQQVDAVPAVFLPASGSDIKSVIKDDALLKRVSDVALVAPHEQDLRGVTVLLDRAERLRIEWVQVLEPGNTVCLYVFGVCR